MHLPFHASYLEMEGEVQAFNRVHRLIDTFEAFSRFLALVAIGDFLSRVGGAGDDEGVRLGGFLGHRLYAPTLGVWHEFLYRVAGYLSGFAGIFSEDVCIYLGCRDKGEALLDFPVGYRGREVVVRNVREAFGLFTRFRNDYAHGGTPPDEVCREDYRVFRPLLDRLLEKARFLQGYRLRAVVGEGAPRVELRRGDGRVLCLYPLMLYDEGAEEYFYLNDARMKHREKLTFLSFGSARKIVDTPSFRHLERILPSFNRQEDEGISRRRRLLDTVVGREGDAAAIERMVSDAPHARVFYIFGDPGIGKSALAAYLERDYFSGCVKVLHMFVHDDVISLQPETLFRTISRALGSAGLIPARELSTANPAEIKNQTSLMLHQASTSAAVDGQRIVLMLDGLDEAFQASEHLYRLLPLVPPPGVYILYFSRRKQEIYSGISRGAAGWTASYELAPLKKDAVRAILWQAVSKYTVSEAMVEHVTAVSQGNPLYLRFLVNAALESRVSLTGDAPLPRDIVAYYHRLLLQALQQAPQLPLIDIALVFSVCREPLHPEQIQGILTGVSLENILLGIDVLAEIIRPSVPEGPGGVKKYRLFHKSAAEYLVGQYPGAAARIEEAVLASVLPRRRGGGGKWLEHFLQPRRGAVVRLRILDERNLSNLLESTRAFPSAYKLLVKKIARHPNAPSILRRCTDMPTARRGRLIFRLIDDCLMEMYLHSPDRYIRLITYLNRRPGGENFKRHILDALVLLRFAPEHYNRMIDLLMGYLLDSPLPLQKNAGWPISRPWPRPPVSRGSPRPSDISEVFARCSSTPGPAAPFPGGNSKKSRNCPPTWRVSPSPPPLHACSPPCGSATTTA